MQSSLTPREIMALLLDEITQQLGSSGAVVFLLDKEHNCLRRRDERPCRQRPGRRALGLFWSSTFPTPAAWSAAPRSATNPTL